MSRMSEIHADLVVGQILSVAKQVGQIVGGFEVEPDLHGPVDLNRQAGPDVEDGPSLGVGLDAEARGHGAKISHSAALWNLHDAVMAGECPMDCPDCGADEWSPSAEAFETTGRMVCETCAAEAMEQAA